MWASVASGEGSREDEIASRVGFEPTTKGLKVPCSAAELPAREQRTRCQPPKAIRSRGLRRRCPVGWCGEAGGETVARDCGGDGQFDTRAIGDQPLLFRGRCLDRQGQGAVAEKMISLREAADRYGVPVVRLGQWCATGKLACERDGDGWMIAVSGSEAIAALVRDHAAMVEEKRVRALVVPVPAAPPDLASRVAGRLGLDDDAVSITPLALDGVDYVVAVWRGEARGDGGLPALRDLAVELDAELLDGEVTGGE